MKLNIGCGYNKKDGYLNVDSDASCNPDLVLNLESHPWPFEDSTISEVVADHVLEHLGATPKDWINVWKELWRVCKNDAIIHVTVPHPRHDNYLVDPTHVRPVFPGTISLFDQERNWRMIQEGGQESKLGISEKIDLEVFDIRWIPAEPWLSAHRRGEASEEQVLRDMSILNNACLEIQMKVRIIKPQRHSR